MREIHFLCPTSNGIISRKKHAFTSVISLFLPTLFPSMPRILLFMVHGPAAASLYVLFI